MSDDAELLRRYAEEGSEAAFAEWVRRHLGLVYAAALRRLGGNAHGAAEVAQGVFLQAAREARVLARRESVTGWLYTATRNAAINLMRDEHRRRQREQAANMLSENEGGVANGRGVADEGTADWARLRPVLDEAMDELGAADREAVLLRFFEGRPFAEVGQRLQLSENTARMRVERALDKLHALLARRGVTSTAAALGLVLANQAGAATTVLPAGLAGSVASGALAGAASGAGVSSGGVGAGIFKFMGLTKTMMAAGGALAICALIGFATWEYQQVRTARSEVEAEQKELAVLTAQVDETERRAKAAEGERAEWTAKLANAQAAAKAGNAARASAGSSLTGASAKSAEPWDPVAAGTAMMNRYPDLKRTRVARDDAETHFGFSPMFKELGFTPAQIAEFTAVMHSGAIMSNPGLGPNGETLAFPSGASLTPAEFNARLQAVLGPDGLPRMAEFFRLRDARNLALQWAGSLAFSDTPALGDQTQAVIRVLMESARQSDGKVGKFDWDAAVGQAAALLSPAQVQALVAMRPASPNVAVPAKKEGGGK